MLEGVVKPAGPQGRHRGIRGHGAAAAARSRKGRGAEGREEGQEGGQREGTEAKAKRKEDFFSERHPPLPPLRFHLRQLGRLALRALRALRARPEVRAACGAKLAAAAAESSALPRQKAQDAGQER